MAISIGKLKDMSTELEAKLKERGIYNSDQFLEAAQTLPGRQALSEYAGVEYRVILELANRADLARVQGIGGVFSDLLEQAGVDTVGELTTRRPENLHAKLLEINAEKKLVDRVPTLDMVKDWVAQAKELPKLLVDELTQRVNRVVESILENERLTADLDDEAAKALLDWGITCAEMIVHSTAGLNDSEAEEVMSPRLRATRRLMRRVNKWVANRPEMDAEANAVSLTGIIEQAAIIYGEDFMPPNDDQRDAFLRQHLAGPSLPMIVNLRKLVEGSGDNSTTSLGGNDG